MASHVPAQQPAPLPETRRADAERNVLRIQEAAIRLWADDPTAGVADVAAAAGVGRATLYRHFPTRESLLEAIRTQGLVDGEDAVENCRLDEGSPTDALSRLMAAWLELGDRYRVVVANPSKPDNLDARGREERLVEAIHKLVQRGQAEGEFSQDVPAMWGASAVGALLVAAIRGVGEGRIRRDEAHTLLIRSCVGALRPS
jgi:TetR/AcrR family transcriptional regulator, mexCD-oprJ operon repressor